MNKDSDICKTCDGFGTIYYDFSYLEPPCAEPCPDCNGVNVHIVCTLCNDSGYTDKIITHPCGGDCYEICKCEAGNIFRQIRENDDCEEISF